jgi:hypothetical protein
MYAMSKRGFPGNSGWSQADLITHHRSYKILDMNSIFRADCLGRLQHSISLYIKKEPQLRSWYSDWLWTGRPRGRNLSPSRAKKFHFSVSSRPALGFTQPPFQWVPGVKRLGRKADHSPQTSAEVKKTWMNTSNLSYIFIA